MVRVSITKLRYFNNLNTFIILAWIVTFILQERVLTYYTISKCAWPYLHLDQPDANSVLLEEGGNNDSVHPHHNQITNVLLIADPQLIDNHTYPGRNSLLLSLSQHTVDVYLKKNYRYLIDHLQPDYIFFLGDYLDNGRSSTDDYFHHELTRFNNIFYNEKLKKKYEKGTNYFLNVPGNHDIGFGDGVKLNSLTRFEAEFSNADSNSIHTINNVDFITFDALSYSSSKADINTTPNQFLEENFGSNIVKSNPRILLTHVPLYRDPSVSCGPLRENPDFNVHGQGYQYKSTVEQKLSEKLLTKVKPDLIFAGDDHDYCDIVHEKFGGSREITVKSISMAMGIKYPAVQLLSFSNFDSSNKVKKSNLLEDFDEQDEQASEKEREKEPVKVNEKEPLKSNFQYETGLCYLQTPYVNVMSYVFLAVLSGVLVLIWNIRHAGSSRFHYTTLLPLSDQVGADNHSNSAKIRNFLREQDEEDRTASLPLNDSTGTTTTESTTHSNDQQLKGISNTAFNLPSTTNKLLHIPNYTFTKTSHSSPSSSTASAIVSLLANTKVGGWMSRKITKVTKFIRRWNLGSFAKQSLSLAVAVIAIYYLLFCLTL